MGWRQRHVVENPEVRGNFEDLEEYLSNDPLTKLPGNPQDGQIINFLADAANGVIWQFRYRAFAKKWEFLGGSRLYSLVETAQAAASEVYEDLATKGPEVTLPLAGDYIIEHGAVLVTSAAVAFVAVMSFAIGGTAAKDANRVLVAGGNEGGFTVGSSVSRTQRINGVAAGTALIAKYRRTNAGTFEQRYLSAQPVRVG